MTAEHIDLNEETRKAVHSLVSRLRQFEAGDDPEPFALEFVMAMRGFGWRPTAAKTQVPWKAAATQVPADPNAEYLAAKAENFGHRRGSDDAA